MATLQEIFAGIDPDLLKTMSTSYEPGVTPSAGDPMGYGAFFNNQFPSAKKKDVSNYVPGYWESLTPEQRKKEGFETHPLFLTKEQVLQRDPNASFGYPSVWTLDDGISFQDHYTPGAKEVKMGGKVGDWREEPGYGYQQSKDENTSFLSDISPLLIMGSLPFAAGGISSALGGAAGAGGITADSIAAGIAGGENAAGAMYGTGAFGATGATNMDPSWFGEAAEYADPIEGLIDLTNQGMTGEQAISALGEINPAWTQTSIEFLFNNPSQIGSAGLNALKSLATGSGAAGKTGALDSLLKLGIPAALIAGLFEKNKSPLEGTLTDAANKAVSSAGAFAGMPSVGMQPSSQKAINLANSSTGAWQPYVDKAATYTDKAAGGIPSINLSTYMNPHLESVLSPAIRDIEEAAARRRKQMKHLADVSGNDTYIPGGTEVTRYGVESGLIDRDTLRAVGDVSANARKGAFDTATGLASTDLNRTGAAGGAFNTLANTVGTQGAKDFTTLGAAGELEAKPQENALTKAADTTKLYTSVIPGTASAATATRPPSILGQAVGAFGAYNAATKPGGIFAS